MLNVCADVFRLRVVLPPAELLSPTSSLSPDATLSPDACVLPTVNMTGSESVGFTQRTSLQTIPAKQASVDIGRDRALSQSEALLTSHASFSDSKC